MSKAKVLSLHIKADNKAVSQEMDGITLESSQSLHCHSETNFHNNSKETNVFEF